MPHQPDFGAALPEHRRRAAKGLRLHLAFPDRFWQPLLRSNVPC